MGGKEKMNGKIIGILVMMLLILTTTYQAFGTIEELTDLIIEDKKIFSSFNEPNEMENDVENHNEQNNIEVTDSGKINSESTGCITRFNTDGDQGLSNDPLSVNINNPSGTVYSRYIIITGSVSTGSYEEKITSWAWYWKYNNQIIGSGGEPLYADSMTFEIEIAGLFLGVNTIEVIVTSNYGGEAMDSVNIIYDDIYAPDLDILSPPDGSEFTNPNIIVNIYAHDHYGTPQWGSGVTKIHWHHVWKDGEYDDTYILDRPYDWVEMSIPILLRKGENDLTFWAEDLDGNVPNYSIIPVTFTYNPQVDTIPPTTTKHVGEPKYTVCDENEECIDYVTSETPFTFTAVDHGGSGVENIFYRTRYLDEWNDWIEFYNEPFYLIGEGQHSIEWYGVDHAGNIEEAQNQNHFVDNTEPRIYLYKNGSKECPNKYALICCGTTKDSDGKGIHDDWVHAAIFTYFVLIEKGYKAQDIVFALWHKNIANTTIDTWIKSLIKLPGWLINGVKLQKPISNSELTNEKINDMWDKSIKDLTHDNVGQGKTYATGKKMFLAALKKLKEKIKDENKDKTEVTIYLTDHGFEWKDMDEHYFSFDDSFDKSLKKVGQIWDRRLSSKELADNLSKIECKKMLIYLDFCYSGGFVNDLKHMDENGKERIIITATDAETTGMFGSNSGSRFFTPFWNNLKSGKKIKDAFDNAKDTCRSLCGGRDQKPQVEYYPDNKKTNLEKYNQFKNESINDETNLNIVPEYGEEVGLDTIFYRVDEGSWLNYIIPLSIKHEGQHLFDFYAVDYLGNQGQLISNNIYVDTTPPGTPDLTYPINGECTCIVPSFDWESVTDFSDVYYTLQVASDKDFSDIIFEIDDLIDSEYIISEEESFPPGLYYWHVRASDGVENIGHWSETSSFKGETENNPPEKPSKPTGSLRGKTEKKYGFSSQAIDSEDDLVCYCFDWGDDIFDWTSWTESGEFVSESHVWYNEGDYSIRVKAVDEHGYESEWSDPLSVSMPINKVSDIPPFLFKFLESHPQLYTIFRNPSFIW